MASWLHPFLEAFSSLLYFAYPVFRITQCPPFFTDFWSFFQGTLSNLDFVHRYDCEFINIFTHSLCTLITMLHDDVNGGCDSDNFAHMTLAHMTMMLCSHDFSYHFYKDSFHILHFHCEFSTSFKPISPFISAVDSSSWLSHQHPNLTP